MTSPVEYAQEALNLTNKMAEESAADNWKEVLKLDKQRVHLLQLCFKDPIEDELQPEVGKLVREIQEINETLMKSAEDKKVEIQDSSINHQRKNHASKA